MDFNNYIKRSDGLGPPLSQLAIKQVAHVTLQNSRFRHYNFTS